MCYRSLIVFLREIVSVGILVYLGDETNEAP